MLVLVNRYNNNTATVSTFEPGPGVVSSVAWGGDGVLSSDVLLELIAQHQTVWLTLINAGYAWVHSMSSSSSTLI